MKLYLISGFKYWIYNYHLNFKQFKFVIAFPNYLVAHS